MIGTYLSARAPIGPAIIPMTDTRTREQRSKIMASVGTMNTGPELTVRKMLHSQGYRYRLFQKRLPGKPDLAFPARRKVVFVHGCFWHGHDCSKGRLPKSSLEYWKPKIAANRERDLRAVQELETLGWRSLVVWQCELKDQPSLRRVLRRFLGKPSTTKAKTR